MNWEEAAVTTVILGFGPLKLADRTWFAAQAGLARWRERRIERARTELARLRRKSARAQLSELYALQLQLEKVQSQVRANQSQVSRLRQSLTERCVCDHTGIEHWNQFDGRCRMWLQRDGQRSHCGCTEYRPVEYWHELKGF